MRKFVICKVVSTGQPWWFDINSRFRAGLVVTFALNRLLVPNHPVRHYALSNATNYTWMSTSANVLKSCSNAAFLSLPCFSCDTIYIISDLIFDCSTITNQSNYVSHLNEHLEEVVLLSAGARDERRLLRRRDHRRHERPHREMLEILQFMQICVR